MLSPKKVPNWYLGQCIYNYLYSFFLGTEAKSSGILVVECVLSGEIFCTYARVVEPQEMRQRGEPPDGSRLDGVGSNRKDKIGIKSCQEYEWKGLEWELATMEKRHAERLK